MSLADQHDGAGIVLYGVRSPLVVDYEESLGRAGIRLVAGVSVEGPSRLIARAALVARDAVVAGHLAYPALACAFATKSRAELHDSAASDGFKAAPSLVDPTAAVAASTRLGPGGFVNAGAVIGAASIFGTGVVVNRVSSIGHHAIIGDFVSIGPGVTIASNVRLGAHAMIGAGAVILPDVAIGEGAIVAAGTLVRRDVPADTMVAGPEARRIDLDPKTTALWRNAQE